jgi:hypothetical protein
MGTHGIPANLANHLREVHEASYDSFHCTSAPGTKKNVVELIVPAVGASKL